MGRLYILIFLLLVSFAGSGKGTHPAYTKHSVHIIQSGTDALAADTVVHHRKHRLIAALLAIPFPFGMIGLHRAYLGTSAAVPFLYFATIGGVFGILPFVDFVLILLCKDVNAYAHNPAIFMWTRRKK